MKLNDVLLFTDFTSQAHKGIEMPADLVIFYRHSRPCLFRLIPGLVLFARACSNVATLRKTARKEIGINSAVKTL